MDNRALYLYGALLTLAEEQSVAIQKPNTNALGFFGKSKIAPRGDKISELINEIIAYKFSKGVGAPAVELHEDIAPIKNGSNNFPKSYGSRVFSTLNSYMSGV